MIIDFHTHTHHSYDSLMKPSKILKLAKKRGLDGIVICDHNTIKGGVEAFNLNKDPNFKVIIGAEIYTDAGDVTGFFLTKEVTARKFDEVVDEIKAQGGKTILNHPYKGHDLTKVDYSQIDFIEGYNSRLSKKDNDKAIALAKEHNIPIIAGSDSHLYNEIANCKTHIYDLDNIEILDCEYKKSNFINITISQYIKAFKRRDLKIAFSATIVYLKSFF